MLGPHRLPCEHPVAPGHIEATPADTRWVLPATILGSSLSFIDGSVVNVALPVMQDSLGGSLATMQWVVNAYMLTLASLILLGGSAGDRFGRRRVFLIGLVGFAAASLGCGVAPTALWLIGARSCSGDGRGAADTCKSGHCQRRIHGRDARSRHRHMGSGRSAHHVARAAAWRMAR